MNSFSCVRLFATPWTVAFQAPLSMGFSRREYWSGLPLPSPPNPLALFLKPSPSLDPLHSDHSDLRSHVSEGRVLTRWAPPDVLSLHEWEVSLVFHEVTEIPVFICCHGITWFPRSDSQTSSTDVTRVLLKGRFLFFAPDVMTHSLIPVPFSFSLCTCFLKHFVV